MKILFKKKAEKYKRIMENFSKELDLATRTQRLKLDMARKTVLQQCPGGKHDLENLYNSDEFGDSMIKTCKKCSYTERIKI